jgi:hypothetical protein
MQPAFRLFAATAALSLVTGPAFAYIGPGAGLGVVAAFWALLVAVVSSIVFLVLWPLRNRLRRRKAGNADALENIPTSPHDERSAPMTSGKADTNTR